MSGLVVCALAAMGAARVAAAEDGQEAAVDLEPLRLDEIPARLYALPRGVAAADAQPAVGATIAVAPELRVEGSLFGVVVLFALGLWARGMSSDDGARTGGS